LDGGKDDRGDEESMNDKDDNGRGRPDKIDFGDRREVEAWLGQVDAYLDDSDRAALAEEISHQFRRAPAGGALEDDLKRTEEGLNWVLEQIETQEAVEVRTHLGQLREQIIEDIESLKQKIIQMELERPDS
jgi:hypothetical protein